MGKYQDITGNRYGRLIALNRVENRLLPCGQRETMYRCVCDCGTEKIMRRQELVRGSSRSCGCLHKEELITRLTTHNKSHSRLFHIHSGMKSRCYNPNQPRYSDYGGRGITICAEWLCDFRTFYDWAIGHGYRDDLSIDRIKNDLGYSPDNCRWATVAEQNNNQRLRKDSPSLRANQTGESTLPISHTKPLPAGTRRNSEKTARLRKMQRLSTI